MADEAPRSPDFGHAVGLVFRTCIREWRTCFALSAAYSLLTAVPSAVFGAIGPELDVRHLTGSEAFAIVAFAVAALGTFALVGLLVYPATLAGLSLVGAAAVAGEPIELGGVVRRALDRALHASVAFLLTVLLILAVPIALGVAGMVVALVGSDIAAGIAVALVFASFVFPGLYVALRTSVSVPVVVAEGLSPTDAIRRSWELLRGAFWWVLGMFIVIGLSSVAVSSVLSLVTNMSPAGAGGRFVFDAIVNVVAGLITISLTGVSVGVVYATWALRAPARGIHADLPPEPPVAETIAEPVSEPPPSDKP